MGLKAGREYLATLQKNIKPMRNRVEKDLADALDLQHAKLVFDTIDSQNYSSVLYALHLFDLLARNELSPEIKNILAEKSGEIEAAALSGRFEAEGAARFPEYFDEFPRQDILKEIPLIMSSDEYQQVMSSRLAALRKDGGLPKIERMELAKAIGLMKPDSPLAAELGDLIEDESPQVSCLALKSAAQLRRKSDLPAIVRKLGDYLTHEDAADALCRYGDAAVATLRKSLKDPSGATELRRAAADVLARIGTPLAVGALAEELECGSGELDRGIIDALDRVRADNAEVPVPRAAATAKIRSLARRYCRIFLEFQERGPGSGSAALRNHLSLELAVCLADIFKLLGLSYPQKGIRTAYQNIVGGNRDALNSAVEWLDNTLRKDARDMVLPLVEDLDAGEKARRLRKLLRILPGS